VKHGTGKKLTPFGFPICFVGEMSVKNRHQTVDKVKHVGHLERTEKEKIKNEKKKKDKKSHDSSFFKILFFVTPIQVISFTLRSLSNISSQNSTLRKTKLTPEKYPQIGLEPPEGIFEGFRV
jgi:hypothetical protein